MDQPAMSRLPGRMIDAGVRLAPAALVDAALRLAARCPAALKSRLFSRACVRVAASAPRDRSSLVATNFGLPGRLRCEVPFGKFDYLFGRPDHIAAERATLALVVELCREATDFLDVGAHEGLFTFAVHARAGARPCLHCFEPDETLFDRLLRNLHTNGVAADGTRAAVSARGGEVVFHRNLSDDASGSTSDYFSERHATERVTVPAVALADYLVSRNVQRALIKIDVEGAGAAAWAGLAAAADRVGWLVLEVLRPEVEARLPARVIAEGGFQAYYIRDFVLVPSRDGAFEYVAPFWNWLFCRLEPAALAARLAGTGFEVAR